MPIDRHDTELAIGDYVTIRCVILQIKEDGDIRVEAVDRPKGEDHWPLIECNSQLFVKVEPPAPVPPHESPEQAHVRLSAEREELEAEREAKKAEAKKDEAKKAPAPAPAAPGKAKHGK